jgi:gas vesicle protein
MTTNDPDQIRAEIEQTRRNLSHHVNELGETVSPGNVAQRQKDKVASKASELKDRVMGSATDAKESVMGTTGDVRTPGQGAVHQAGTTVQDLPAKARRQTQGNPLAVGLIALGAGWLVGSLLPASEKEREAAQTVKDKAQPLVEEAKAAGQEVAGHLKEPAQQAAEEVKASAQDSVDTVKGEAQSTAQDVKGSAQESKDSLQSSGSSGSI